MVLFYVRFYLLVVLSLRFYQHAVFRALFNRILPRVHRMQFDDVTTGGELVRDQPSEYLPRRFHIRKC